MDFPSSSGAPSLPPSSPLRSRSNMATNGATAASTRLDPLAFGATTSAHQPNTATDGNTNPIGSGYQGYSGQSSVYSHSDALGREDSRSVRAGGVVGAAADSERTSRRGRPANLNRADNVPPVQDELGERVRESFSDFLEHFTEEPLSGSPDPDGEKTHDPVYIDQLYAMRDFGRTTLFVDFSHVLQHEQVLARAISEQYYRFLPHLRRAVLDLVNTYIPKYLYVNAHLASTAQAGLILRDFNVSFYNLGLVSGIRALVTSQIGRLISISGTVTRTSEVRPELLWGAFTCGECSTTVTDVEQQFKYTEPVMCKNRVCNNKRDWTLNVEQSRFADWQKVRVQENANEIPTGSMPRSLDIILRSEIVERAKAGDKCIFTGTFIVVPDVSQLGVPGVNAQMQRESGGGRPSDGISAGVTGLKTLGVRDLTYKTAFLACMVQSADTRSGGDIRASSGAAAAGAADEAEEDPETLMDSLTEEERDELEAMVSSENIYSRLVQSIAPTVYGHDIVKKGILLQLMGGVHKQTPEGIHLRGDINICIVGDPSTSKSQFLKYVCGFLPRAVYTSGKASSAAGLTAAVVRDEETGEFTIEAGALMLADNGICAIDEFDKMDISDQVAIHEAMEQQTISIAKAGIQATLNARTSILAAANPVGGRYNRKQTLRANVAMSAPIMSRFDLFFVVLDECNESVDMNIAQHIINVHRFKDAAIKPEFTTEAIQRYIRYARTFTPKLTPEASDVLVEKYRQLREDDAGGSGKNSYRITVRQLESMIRLSEGIARANCRHDITPAFVREAYALLKQSIIHVEKDDIDFDEEEQTELGAIEAMDREMEEEIRGASTVPPTSSIGADNLMDTDESLPQGYANAQDAGVPSTPAPAGEAAATTTSGRRKIKITYDRYMEITNLIVLRVSELERSTMRGIPKDELVQWYLEQKEGEIESLDQLDEEKELIQKVLAKLVKDQFLIELKGAATSQSSESQATGQRGQAAQQSAIDETQFAPATQTTAAAGAADSMPAATTGTDSSAASTQTVLMLHPRIDIDSLGDSSSLS